MEDARELLAALNAFPPGSQVARFEVRHEVGRGGAGVVLRAWDPQLEREVAVKLLAPERVLDPKAKARFQREAIAASRLKHPHLAQVYELGEANGQPFLVMEWVDGQSLQSLLKDRGTLPYSEALELLRQVAEGLDYAHQHEVVHRDVKTANIMVDPRGQAILVDFGLAAVASSQSMTETGAVLGTPLYMSPEQIEGEVAGAPSDLYSLALVFYEMVTGAPPFQGDTVWAGFHLKLNDPPPKLSGKLPGLTAGHDAALARALAISPEARFPTGKALVEALREPPPPARARRTRWEFALVPLLAVGVGMALLGRGLTTPPPVSVPTSTPSVALKAQWTEKCPRLEGLAMGEWFLAASTEEGELRCFDGDHGHPRWTRKLLAAPSGAPAIVGQPELVVVGGEGFLSAYDLRSGKPAWSVAESASSVSVGPDGNLWAALDEQVGCFSPDGRGLGRVTLPGSGLLLPPVATADMVYTAGERSGVVAFSPSTRKVTWRTPLARPLGLALEADKGVVVVTTSSEVRGLSRQDGSQVWRVELPGVPVGVVTGSGLVVVACEGGEVLVLDGEGQEKWQARAEAELAVPPVIAGASVIAAGVQALHVYDLLGNESLTVKTPDAWLAPLVKGPRLFLAGPGTIACYQF